MLNKIRQRKVDMKTLSSIMTTSMSVAGENGPAAAGAHHLLVAVVSNQEDQSGRQALVNAGADPDQLCDAIEKAIGAGLPAMELPAVSPAEKSGGKVTVDATYEAAITTTQGFHNSGSEPSPLRTAHFVAGVASLEHGLVPRVLAELGVEAAKLVDSAVDAAS